MNGTILRIVINEILDNTFYAIVEIQIKDDSKKIIKIDSRPSDALAIAVRTKSPIFVSEAVMVKAKMVNAEKDEEESKNFKNFIDNINPDDFAKYFDKR
jgi:hypothetical protein